MCMKYATVVCVCALFISRILADTAIIMCIETECINDVQNRNSEVIYKIILCFCLLLTRYIQTQMNFMYNVLYIF